MKIFRKSFTKYALYFMAALLPAQPLMAAPASMTQDQQAMMAQILSQMQAGSAKDSLATRALGQLDEPATSIMDKAAYNELAMQSLAAKLDKTETQVGSVIFKNSFNPTTDIAAITQRQILAKALLNDSKLYSGVQDKLQRIKKSEQALLAYWDQSNMLFAQTDAFYYDWLKSIFGEKINTNRWALETAMIWQAGNSVWNMLFYLVFK